MNMRTTMKIHRLAMTVLLSLGALYAQFRPTEDYFKNGVPPAAAGEPVFSLSIRAAGQNQVMAGRDMNVEITLTNISKEDIYITDITPYLKYIWDVRGPDGEPRPLTKAGRDGLANQDKLIARNMPTLLRPKESLKTIASAALNFDTWEVGMYTVQLRKKISPYLGGSEVESNKIVFTVIYNPIMDRLKAQGALKETPSTSPTPAKNR